MGVKVMETESDDAVACIGISRAAAETDDDGSVTEADGDSDQPTTAD